MNQTSNDMLSVLLGWVIVAIPVGLLLWLATWVSVNRFGVSRGVANAVALGVWGAFLFWRWRRSQV